MRGSEADGREREGGGRRRMKKMGERGREGV